MNPPIFIQTGRRLDTDQPFGFINHGRLLDDKPTIANHSFVDYGDRIWCVPNADIKFETPFTYRKSGDYIIVHFFYHEAENQARVNLVTREFWSTFFFIGHGFAYDPELFKLCRFADQMIVNIALEKLNAPQD